MMNRNWLSYTLALALLAASCAEKQDIPADPDPETDLVPMTFGASLDEAP